MRFLRARTFLIIAILLIPTFAHAQNVMTSITANLVSAGPTPTTGTICFTPVDKYGNPIAITRFGGGFYIQGRSFCGTLTAGALTAAISVPDSGTDSAPGHGYQMVIYDTVAKLSSSPMNIYNITGTSWVLDNYIPAAAVVTTNAFTYTESSSAPTGACTVPALWGNGTTGSLYHCYGGAWVLMTGTGAAGTPGATGPAGAAATIAIGTVTTGAAGTSAAVTNSGSPNAAVLNFTIPQGATGAAGSGGGATLPSTSNVLKGNGSGGALAATPGTDYLVPANLPVAAAAWSSSVTYTLNSIVTYNGLSYVSIQNGNLNNTPATGSWWLQVLGSSVVTSITTSGTSGPATLIGGVLNIPQYSVSFTLTTTGSGGPATYTGGVLNIPQYSGGGGGGSGTVNTGTAFGIAYYPAAGTTVSSSTACNGVGYFSTTAAPVCASASQILTAIGTIPSTSLPAATTSAQGAVVLPAGAGSNTLGTAAMQAATAFDANGAAAAAQAAATAAAETASEATFTGDVQKSANSFVTKVLAVQGIPVSSTAPSVVGQSWVWNGSTMVPGTATPPTTLNVFSAAGCASGTASEFALLTYDNQQPQGGCYSSSTTTAAYLAFNPATTVPQYAEGKLPLPPYWTGSAAIIESSSGAYGAIAAATSGTMIWEVQYYCVAANAVPGSGTYGTATAVPVTVSTTAGGDTFSSSFTLAANSTNGCPAATSTTPAILFFRLSRSLTDGMVSNANLNSVITTTGRAQ